MLYLFTHGLGLYYLAIARSKIIKYKGPAHVVLIYTWAGPLLPGYRSVKKKSNIKAQPMCKRVQHHNAHELFLKHELS